MTGAVVRGARNPFRSRPRAAVVVLLLALVTGFLGLMVHKVPKGTQIKKGNDHVFLPGLKGSQVAIAYAHDKEARVATSIEVRSAKP